MAEAARVHALQFSWDRSMEALFGSSIRPPSRAAPRTCSRMRRDRSRSPPDGSRRIHLMSDDSDACATGSEFDYDLAAFLAVAAARRAG